MPDNLVRVQSMKDVHLPRSLPKTLRTAFTLLIATAFVGCGGLSDTVTVHGTVKYQGSPVPGSLTFYPMSGRPVNAAVAADGTYQADLPPGEYTVTVNYTEPLPPGFKEGDPMPRPKIVLPPEFSTRTKSTLSATVAADQSEPVNFDL